MGFIKCKSCGGYYRLQSGESIDDFGVCRCGGSLKYVQSLKAATIDELGPFGKTKICSRCGKENIKTSQICVFCGKKLDKKLTISNELLRLASVFIGVVIVAIPLVLFSIGIDMVIIGGFVSSVLVNKNEKEGILDGILLGLISGLVFSAYNGILGFNLVFYNILPFCMILIAAVIIGLLGGLSGVIVRSTVTNKNILYPLNFKSIIIGFILCSIPILFFQSILGLLIVVLGGAVAAYLTNGEYRSGIRNGFITGSLIAALLVLLFVFNNLNDPAMITDKILHIGVVLLIGGLLGSLGGLIGSNIKKSYGIYNY